MSDARTLNYYNSNAAVFSETTKNVDFSEVQQIFTNHLSPDASILDFGCGSGRDTRYFINHGYHVTATDGSEMICKMATKYTGIQVKQMLFEELDDRTNMMESGHVPPFFIYLEKNYQIYFIKCIRH